jgi:hypothetical protein
VALAHDRRAREPAGESGHASWPVQVHRSANA